MEIRTVTNSCVSVGLEARDDHVEAFGALSHLTRLRIFFFLAQAPDEVFAGQIQEQIGVPAPTLSHHLAILERAGLLERRREQRFIYYSVRKETVSELLRLLTNCC